MPVEFLLDFGQFYPEGEEAQLHTRVITSPIYAKALFVTLEDLASAIQALVAHKVAA